MARIESRLADGKKTDPHDGGNFDDFIKEQGIYEEVVSRAKLAEEARKKASPERPAEFWR